MNKKQIQQKQKATLERENNQKIIKTPEKAKRELEGQNATLITINYELEAKILSNNRHLNNINRNNGHQVIKKKDNQNMMEKENGNENSTKIFSIYVTDMTYCQNQQRQQLMKNKIKQTK